MYEYGDGSKYIPENYYGTSYGDERGNGYGYGFNFGFPNGNGDGIGSKCLSFYNNGHGNDIEKTFILEWDMQDQIFEVLKK